MVGIAAVLPFSPRRLQRDPAESAQTCLPLDGGERDLAPEHDDLARAGEATGRTLRELRRLAVSLVADPHENFDLIMKDGAIYKNTLQ